MAGKLTRSQVLYSAEDNIVSAQLELAKVKIIHRELTRVRDILHVENSSVLFLLRKELNKIKF